jgi:hypothetical protein
MLPLVLMMLIAFAVKVRTDSTEFVLDLPDGLEDRVVTMVIRNWNYERERMAHSLDRVRLQASLVGLSVSVVLACAVVVVAWSRTVPTINVRGLEILTATVAVAAVAAFYWMWVRLLVRIASQDFNSRMFAWGSRSIVITVTASAGLYLVLARAAGSVVDSLGKGALLGIFVALIGDKAIPYVIDKTAALFGYQPPRRLEDMGLQLVSGITDPDVDRFAEEGILSVQDLAFTPTARLFFNSTHSLQRICDWQDQALLLVYFGQVRAKAMFEKLTIRGAMDLLSLARIALRDDPEAPKRSRTGMGKRLAAAGVKPSQIRAALGDALGLKDAALLTALLVISDDEATLRLQAHWISAVKSANHKCRP